MNIEIAFLAKESGLRPDEIEQLPVMIAEAILKHHPGLHDQRRHGRKHKANSIEEAVKLLGEGKNVQFDQPREVSTLLSRLKEIADDAKAKGDKAPDYDLCRVSVKGTNLFCAQSKGIPRLKMPQLGGKPTPGSKADKLPKNKDGEVDLSAQFREHLESHGIKSTRKKEKASFLRASQSQLDGAKIAGMTKSLEAGTLPPGAIFTSRDNYVVDGHHRWAANVGHDLADNVEGDVEMDVVEVDMPILDVLDWANHFAAEWGIPQADVNQRIDEPAKKEPVGKFLPSALVNGPPCVGCGPQVVIELKDFDPNQPRGRDGRWTDALGGVVSAISRTFREAGQRRQERRERAKWTPESAEEIAQHWTGPKRTSNLTTPQVGSSPQAARRKRMIADARERNPEFASHEKRIRETMRRAEIDAGSTAELDEAGMPIVNKDGSLALMSKLDTRAANDNMPGYGEERYTKERQRQHREIVRDLLADAYRRDVPKERRGVVMAGPPGAGKTSAIKAGMIPGVEDPDKWLNVNADDVKVEMVRRGMVPDIPGVDPLEHVSTYHEESSDISKLLFAAATEQGFNTIYDVTLGSPKAGKKKLEAFRRANYDHVTMAMVKIPPETSFERTLGRYMRGRGETVERYYPDTMFQIPPKPEDREHMVVGGRFLDPVFATSLVEDSDGYPSVSEWAFRQAWLEADKGVILDAGSGPTKLEEERGRDWHPPLPGNDMEIVPFGMPVWNRPPRAPLSGF